MNRYQMAKLVSWAGCVRSRKRLQKVVYLLQSAGCPIEADYFLHFYGPYSEDVARRTDEMVRQNQLSESQSGPQYDYQLGEGVAVRIAEVEKTESGKKWAAELAQFETFAKKLLGEGLKELEHASTIVYFRRQGHAWDLAVQKATEFKKTEDVRNALPLAQSVID